MRFTHFTKKSAIAFPRILNRDINEIHGMDSSVTGKSRGMRHRALDLLYGAKSKLSRDDAGFL
jgi:hypothetical protein